MAEPASGADPADPAPRADRYGALRYRPENWFWREGEVAAGRAVIFDVDGVLADATHRQHLVQGYRQNWDRFFEMCGKDPIIEPVVRLKELLDPALTVILLTARPSWVAPETLQWCARHKLRWDLLIMREYGDYSMARDFKEFSVDEIRKYGFDPELAFDDDARNVAMFERVGIPCVYIHSGYH